MWMRAIQSSQYGDIETKWKQLHRFNQHFCIAYGKKDKLTLKYKVSPFIVTRSCKMIKKVSKSISEYHSPLNGMDIEINNEIDNSMLDALDLDIPDGEEQEQPLLPNEVDDEEKKMETNYQSQATLDSSRILNRNQSSSNTLLSSNDPNQSQQGMLILNPIFVSIFLYYFQHILALNIFETYTQIQKISIMTKRKQRNMNLYRNYLMISMILMNMKLTMWMKKH